MNKAYETMRGFWLDVNNLQHKKEVPLLAARKICIAGVEMAARDRQGSVKNLMIAASSLGNASVYFENNSPSGLGGFTGGSSSGPVRDKALRLMQAAAAAAAADMLPAAAEVMAPNDPEQVTLFALSGDGQIYAQQLPEAQARNPENDLYPFFAYSQQLLGAFRTEQEAASAGNLAQPAQAQAQAQTTAPSAGSNPEKEPSAQLSQSGVSNLQAPQGPETAAVTATAAGTQGSAATENTAPDQTTVPAPLHIVPSLTPDTEKEA